MNQQYNKIVTTWLMILAAALLVNGQPNVSAPGLRVGGVSGLSYKHIDSDLKGVELILGWKENGMRLTGLVQYYKSLADGRFPGLYYFTGFGGHSGYTRYDVTYMVRSEGIDYYKRYRSTSPVLGGDFIGGIEYHFQSVPLLITVDYKPYFEVFGEKDFRVDLWDFGFSIRYNFNT